MPEKGYRKRNARKRYLRDMAGKKKVREMPEN